MQLNDQYEVLQDKVDLMYEPLYHMPHQLHHLKSHQSLQIDNDLSYKLTQYVHLKQLKLTVETPAVLLIDLHKYAPQCDELQLKEYYEQMLKLSLH